MEQFSDLNILTINDLKDAEGGSADASEFFKKAFREKDYIPKKNYGKCFKFGFITSVVLAVIFLIAIIVGVVRFNSEGSKSRFSRSPSNDSVVTQKPESEDKTNHEFPDDSIRTIPINSEEMTTSTSVTMKVITTTETVVTSTVPSTQQNTSPEKELTGSTAESRKISSTVGVSLALPHDNSIKSNKNLTDDGEVSLLLIGDRGFTEFNLQNKSKSEFKDVGDDYGVLEVFGKDNIFWYNPSLTTIHYQLSSGVMSDNKSRSGDLLRDPRVTVHDMAYDHIGENLYAIDQSTESLFVIDVKTKEYSILLTDLIRPHRIELDPASGYLFILQKEHSILKSNMDASNVEIFISSRNLKTMTVDRNSKKIYWADAIDGVASSDYNGDNKQRYPIYSVNVHDLAVVNDQLVWLWQLDFGRNPTHHLVTCQIRDKLCENRTMHEIHPLGDFASIKVSHSKPKRDLAVYNGCRNNNGGCQHLCLLKPNGGHSCACKLGWQLSSDGTSCQVIEEFMLYTYGKFFRGRILDDSRNVSVDVIWPTPFEANPSKYAYDVSFDYDQKNDILYFSDRKNIYSRKLKSRSEEESILLYGNNSTVIGDLAYDWLSGNLYYVQHKNEDGYRIKVMNVKLGGGYIKTLINYTATENKYKNYTSSKNKDEKDSNGVVVNSLAIDPINGYLFYLTAEKKIGYLHKLTMNGTEIITIPDHYYDQDSMKALTIDNLEKKIYWINHEYLSLIRFVNFDGKNLGYVTADDMITCTGIAVHQDWLYISSPTNIERFDKRQVMDEVEMAPNRVVTNYNTDRVPMPISGMKIVSQPKVKDGYVHPCDDTRNGGCEQFCFLQDSRAACACRDGDSIGLDGRCSRAR